MSTSDADRDAADLLAVLLGLTRSELFRRAIEFYLEHGDTDADPAAGGNDHRQDSNP